MVSWPQGNKKPTTRQLHSTAGAGSGWGAFWGFLLADLFVPLLGMAMVQGTVALSGSLADVGIDDDFIRQVREKVTPGTSALFALTSGATAPDRVIDELRQYDSRSSPPTSQRSRRTICARPSPKSSRATRCRAALSVTALSDAGGCITEAYADDGVKDAHEARRHRDVVHGSVFRSVVLVSVGVLWWSGDVARGILIGVSGVRRRLLVRRCSHGHGAIGGRSTNDHKRSRAGHDG